ncbi:MAG TPA: hypothetical protein VK147_09380, partial [Candidatus Didemnitutus sp.]|nr:hypothetical protein [Candidatus Didemnitutus sp.]
YRMHSRVLACDSAAYFAGQLTAHFGAESIAHFGAEFTAHFDAEFTAHFDAEFTAQLATERGVHITRIFQYSTATSEIINTMIRLRIAHVIASAIMY